MRIGLVSAIACGAVSVAAVGAVAASGGHLPRHYQPVVVHSHHKRCTKTVINGLNDKGSAIGTEFCGKPGAFIRSPGGAVTRVALPKSYGASKLVASNLASNGIMAVVALGSPSRSYLVYPNGKVVRVAVPVAAGHTTIVNGVNRHGTAVGNYCTTRKCKVSYPYIYHAGHYRGFVLHHKGAVLTSLNAITDSGELSGFFYQAPSGRARGFVKRGHKLRMIDAPKAGHKIAQGTLLTNAGNHGALCGEVIGKHQLRAGFVQRRGHIHLVSLYRRHRGSFTEVTACNGHGEIGGHARNAPAHRYHAFLAKVG